MRERKREGKNNKVTRRMTTNDHFRIFCFYSFGTEQRDSERKKRKRGEKKYRKKEKSHNQQINNNRLMIKIDLQFVHFLFHFPTLFFLLLFPFSLPLFLSSYPLPPNGWKEQFIQKHNQLISSSSKRSLPHLLNFLSSLLLNRKRFWMKNISWFDNFRSKTFWLQIFDREVNKMMAAKDDQMMMMTKDDQKMMKITIRPIFSSFSSSSHILHDHHVLLHNALLLLHDVLLLLHDNNTFSSSFSYNNLLHSQIHSLVNWGYRLRRTEWTVSLLINILINVLINSVQGETEGTEVVGRLLIRMMMKINWE